MADGKDVEILDKGELKDYFEDLHYATERFIKVDIQKEDQKGNMKF